MSDSSVAWDRMPRRESSTHHFVPRRVAQPVWSRAQLHGLCVLRREEFHFLSESTLFLLPSLRISIFMQFSNSDVSFLECPLDHETFDLVLEGTNLAHQVRSLVRGDAAADHSSRDSAGTA